MKSIRHSISIRAPREAVWAAMLGPETYRAWTAPFCEGSYCEGSWNTGDRIRFLGPGGQEGMTSVIAESRPPEFVSIKHLGIIKDGVEDMTSPAAAAWAPSFENYTFVDAGGATELTVDVESSPDFEAFMNEAWPKALAKLKEICE
jgi:uncharacterized protein YndB with AHSA1/START domain